ncbi:unnamed protein product [Diatraea saccharalis]|uniref:Uncharacterized protein n=1 Tax=Diatraea saccharalis TaxID=40085 RepID=A0A9N9REK6_9NEOP|nr:unnamed protein product [Diatraea saccharalis]
MVWKHISIIGLALVAVSAYRQIPPYSGYYDFSGYPRSIHQQPTYDQSNDQRSTLERRIDTRNVDVYDRYDRVPSERSIPFRSSSQRVQAQEWSRNDDAEPRNGNISVKIGKRRGLYFILF